jgi:hypothetical protein
VPLGAWRARLPTNTSKVTRVKLINSPPREAAGPGLGRQCGMNALQIVRGKTDSSEPEDVMKPNRRFNAPSASARRSSTAGRAAPWGAHDASAQKAATMDRRSPHIPAHEARDCSQSHVSVMLHGLYLDGKSSCSWLTGGRWSAWAPANSSARTHSSRWKAIGRYERMDDVNR